ENTAARPQPVHGLGEKDRRGRAPPLRIGRREVAADVAIRERAEDRIGDGVRENIRIGMTNQPVIMRNLAAAEPDMVAQTESVDIETLTHADVEQRAEELRFREAEILAVGNF